MNKEIYCYNIDDMDQHILNTIAASLNIEIFLLDDGMMDNTVREILKHQPHSNQDCTRYEAALMLMNNIDDEDLESILDQTSAVKWGVDPLKVKVSDANMELTLSELLNNTVIK